MRIPDLFGRAGPVFSFEFFLPKRLEDMPAFKKMVLAVKSLQPSFVTLTYGAGGSARERTIEVAGMIHNDLGIETAAHLTCITHTRAEILDILERIRSHRIENIVALRGDRPKDASLPAPEPRPLRYAADLVRCIRERCDWGMAVAGYPQGHPECPSKEQDLLHLKAKLDAGADWVITQLFFDNRDYFDFTARARAAGIRAPIVPGIFPITNLPQLQRLTALCGATLPQDMVADMQTLQGDPEATMRYGLDRTTKQCRELLDRGAPGIHFYTLNVSSPAAAIMSRLRR